MPITPRFSLMLAALVIGMSRQTVLAAGTESASFLDIPVGAGPAALGGAYSALATNLYAPVWNPAGLGFLDSTEVGGQHLSYLESIHYEHIGAVIPIKSSMGLGVSAQYLGSGDIAGVALDGTALPDYSNHYAAYTVAYGQSMGNLSLGVAGKVIDAQLSDVSAQAYAADLGALYKVGGNTTLAATLTNLGSELKFLSDSSPLPMAGHLGIAYAPSRQWLTSVEGVFPRSGPAAAHLGVQWQPLQLIAIRAGYKTDTTKELGAMAGLTLGAGIHIWGQELAYAWVPYGDLGDTQYVSLILRFGASKKAQKNLIQAPQQKKQRLAGSPASDDADEQQFMQMLKTDEETQGRRAKSNDGKVQP